MNAPNLMQIKNLSFTIDNQNILENISFDIQNEDFITIIGPNGAGKSTLAKCLIGRLKPNSGQITKARDIKIAYVPQRFVVEEMFAVSVLEFLKLKLRLNLAELEEILYLTNTFYIRHKMLHQLSGGEFQRVLMARAILKKPNLLILDEPAQNLDVNSEIQFYELLQNIYKQQHLSVMLISHDLHFVMNISQKVLCIYHHICCWGTPSTIMKDKKFIELFGQKFMHLFAPFAYHHHRHKHEGSFKDV